MSASAIEEGASKGSHVSAGSGYIVGPLYDWFFFLSQPMLALGIGYLVSTADVFRQDVQFGMQNEKLAGLVMGIIIHAHLVAVFFRSHGNKDVFGVHPARFVVVPIVLFAAMMSSEWVLATAAVVAVFWDVYHSGAQTFGFGRIYDARIGNDPNRTRGPDFWLQQVLYAGPIVAGVSLTNHLRIFHEFERVESSFWTEVPMRIQERESAFVPLVLGACVLYLVYYVAVSIYSALRGYRHSPQKIFLYVTTGAVSIYAWGFNTWGEAYLIMNLFHAVQYFGIVWAMEGKQIKKRLRVRSGMVGSCLALAAFYLPIFAYGAFVESYYRGAESLFAVTLVCSLLHFWYDGFIWSVRKRTV